MCGAVRLARKRGAGRHSPVKPDSLESAVTFVDIPVWNYQWLVAG